MWLIFTGLVICRSFHWDHMSQTHTAHMIPKQYHKQRSHDLKTIFPEITWSQNSIISRDHIICYRALQIGCQCLMKIVLTSCGMTPIKILESHVSNKSLLAIFYRMWCYRDLWFWQPICKAQYHVFWFLAYCNSNMRSNFK